MEASWYNVYSVPERIDVMRSAGLRVLLTLAVLLCVVLLVMGVRYHRHHFSASPFAASHPPVVAQVTPEYLQDKRWVQARREVEQTDMPRITRERAQWRREIPAHTFSRGSSAKKLIALTFDDGPHPDYAPKILAILARHQIHATFFVVGVTALKYPRLVRDEFAAGNAIGNHTYHHLQPFRSIPEWEMATEIKADGEVIHSLTGVAPHLFRPPGGGFDARGGYDQSIATVATALGYTSVMWTDDPGDFDPAISTAVLTERLLKHIGNGAVILLHDGGKHTIELLPHLITTLQQQRYQFVTVDELIRQSRTATQP